MNKYKSSPNMNNKVVKSHRIITALQNLSLTEMRLIQLAIIDAREQEAGLQPNKPLQIHARRYAEAFGVQIDTAYKVLSEAGKTLRSRYFKFINYRENEVETNWVQQVEYVKKEARIEIIFTVAVVDEITRLSSHFTQYDLEFIATLNSIYSVRLYELIVKWLSVKQTDVFDYEILRGQLGIGVNEYQRMTDFKKRVLDLAVNEINEKTDVKVSYSQEKNGTKIVGFKFKVNKKSKKPVITKSIERDADNGDMFTIDGLSDRQLGRIARSPQFCKDFGDLIPATSPINKDMNLWADEFIRRLKENPEPFNKKQPIREYLIY